MPDEFYDLIQGYGNCNTPLNLLLGNGFSIACSESFSYKNLYEIIPPDLKKYFDETYDFENAQGYTEYVATYHEFCIDPTLGSLLREDIPRIQEALINTILNIHPRFNEIPYIQKSHTLDFLVKFDNIFTLNYDLLLYWLIMFNKHSNIYKQAKFDDGFRRPNEFDCIWENPYYKQNVFYLHGGLHLFANAYNTYKIKTNNNRPLIPIIQELRKENNKPLIITEKDSECKYQSIQNNTYLRFCYNQLEQINGYLIIHGHSMDKKDNHIFQAINNNYKIRKIFVSVYKNDEKVIQNAYERFPYKEILFYDAGSVRLWE